MEVLATEFQTVHSSMSSVRLGGHLPDEYHPSCSPPRDPVQRPLAWRGGTNQSHGSIHRACGGLAWLVGASVGGSSKLFGVEMDGLGTLLLRHLGARVA